MRNLALVWVLAACLLGCGGDKDAKDKAVSAVNTVATFTDTRDGKVYRIVKIGSQTWFAENLNYAAEESVCYEDKDANCATYGRMYNWKTALTACPAGTHLPSDKEWTTLVYYAGGAEKAGTKLKSSTGWNSYKGVSGGTDAYGFSALPGGYGQSRGNFNTAGGHGYWWSATKFNAGNAWGRGMYYVRELVDRDDYYKTNQFSVRCVKDNEKERRK